MLFSILILLTCCQEKIEYKEHLKTIDKQYQLCLDKGEAMHECSRQYMLRMDSMLNIIYKDLISIYDKKEQDELRIKELIWIKEKDNKFTIEWNNLKKLNIQNGFIPQDDKMMTYDNEAKFIRKRVDELVAELEKGKK